MYQLTIGDFFERSAQVHAEKEALIFQNRRLTYAQLNERVNQLANGLLSLGFQKGDKLALLLNNGIEIVEALLACAKTGIVVVPINTRLTRREVQYCVDNVDSKGIIFDGDQCKPPFKQRI